MPRLLDFFQVRPYTVKPQAPGQLLSRCMMKTIIYVTFIFRSNSNQLALSRRNNIFLLLRLQKEKTAEKLCVTGIYLLTLFVSLCFWFFFSVLLLDWTILFQLF